MSTEEKILTAARCEFMQKGFEGARMRSIAERADINKGLLHYYFKSKEQLLIEVFQETFKELFEALAIALNNDNDLFQKIRATVDAYTDFILNHTELPHFIIMEMNRDALEHSNRMKKAGIKPPLKPFAQAFKEAQREGRIRKDIEANEVILNMISMILFPVVAKPMVQYMHNINEEFYLQMLQKRKEQISNFIINAIKA